MQKKYLSPDEATGGSGGQETKIAPDFSKLTEEMFEPGYKPKEVEAEKKIEVTTEKEVTEAAPELIIEAEKVTESAPEVKKEEITTPAATEEKKEESFELKLDLTSTPETKVWAEKAKEVFGIELQEDSIDAFVNTTKEQLLAAEERGKQTTIEKELAALSPEAQIDFILLREGLTREEINAPTKQIDDILTMSNIDIVRKDLELKLKHLDEGKRNEIIDKEIEILTDKDVIDHEAEKLRAVLHQAKESVLKEREELAKSVATNYEAKQHAAKQAELQSINTALDTVKDFMGFPITDANKSEIAKRNLEGKFESIFNDPEKRAKFILFDLFGEQAVKGLRNKAFEEGREKVTKELSNVPPTPRYNNSQSTVKQSAATASGFDKLESLFPAK